MEASKDTGEDANLIGGLIRTDSPKFRWSVSREQDKWNSTVVGLQDRGVQICNGSSGGSNYYAWLSGCHCSSKGRES